MFTLPELPYEYDALAPFISADIQHLHHSAHHAAYVKNLNTALEKYPDWQNKKIEEIIVSLDKVPEDVRTVVRWVSDRKDVDARRVAVLGHAEGAWVTMLAAARERRITAFVSVDAPSTTGADLALEQQQHALDRLQATPAERAQKIELQKKVQAAVLTGKGWEGVPPDLRKQADTPWTQSVLSFDPARVIEDVRQPMLFLHAELDRQIPVSHVERLVDIARKESKSKSVEVVTVRGVNHLLVPAVTGEQDEYASLSDLNVSQDVTSAVTAWFTKTLSASQR